jgi:hypothetical protein
MSTKSYVNFPFERSILKTLWRTISSKCFNSNKDAGQNMPLPEKLPSVYRIWRRGCHPRKSPNIGMAIMALGTASFSGKASWKNSFKVSQAQRLSSERRLLS